jgi:[acyl-carrier-protein] S-malonyltransferase
MAMDFVRAHAEARAAVDEADSAFGGGLRRLLESGPADELARTEITQPAILAASIAIWRVVEPRLPRAPLLFAGHSLGEYSALVAAGGLPLADAVRLVRRRGALMQERCRRRHGGGLGLSRRGGADLRRGRRRGRTREFNSPVQTVIAADHGVASAGERMTAAGAKRVIAPDVSRPLQADGARDGELPEPRRTLLRLRCRWCRTSMRAHASGVARASRDRSARRGWVDCVKWSPRGRSRAEIGPGRVSGLAAKIDRSSPRERGEARDPIALARAAEACMTDLARGTRPRPGVVRIGRAIARARRAGAIVEFTYVQSDGRGRDGEASPRPAAARGSATSRTTKPSSSSSPRSRRSTIASTSRSTTRASRATS